MNKNTRLLEQTYKKPNNFPSLEAFVLDDVFKIILIKKKKICLKNALSRSAVKFLSLA